MANKLDNKKPFAKQSKKVTWLEWLKLKIK